MSVLLSVIGAFCTSIAYALVLHAPKVTLVASACNGALVWLLYQLLQSSVGDIAGMFLASLCMAFGSQWLARHYKTPVTVILIPSFIPFVPGGDIYRCIYYLLQDQASLSLHYLGNTLLISGMIALGAMSSEACMTYVKRQTKRKEMQRWKKF